MSKITHAVWDFLVRLATTVFEFIFKILKIKLDERKNEKFMQFIKFCIVGCMNAVVLIIVSSLVIKTFSLFGFTGTFLGIENFHLQMSSVIGFLCKVLNSYYWNGTFVFPSDEKKTFFRHVQCYLKLVLSYLVSFVVALLLNILWKKIGLSDYLCNPINEIITLPLNFVMDKFFAFAKRKKA